MAANPVHTRPGFPRRIAWGRQMLILFHGLKHPETPLRARIPALLSLVYLISPIDLVPDFIPFAGWIDDLLIVPLLLSFSFRLLPPRVLESSLVKAEKDAGKARIVMIVLAALALLALAGFFLLLRKWLS